LKLIILNTESRFLQHQLDNIDQSQPIIITYDHRTTVDTRLRHPSS